MTIYMNTNMNLYHDRNTELRGDVNFGGHFESCTVDKNFTVYIPEDNRTRSA